MQLGDATPRAEASRGTVPRNRAGEANPMFGMNWDAVPRLRVREANATLGMNEWMGQGEGLDASCFAAAAASGWSLWMLAAR